MFKYVQNVYIFLNKFIKRVKTMSYMYLIKIV